MSLKGIDVSYYQGTIDWNKVKNAGYQFAMLRAGYGFNTVDSQFRRNASECNRLGIPIGVYWFCYALDTKSAIQEAEGCLDAIADFRLDYPVCYDMEEASIGYASKHGVTINSTMATNIVKAFCDHIEDNGYFAMYYSNKHFLQSYFSPALSEEYALWYAYYRKTLDNPNCGMWQYTSEGKVPGIHGHVDMNLCFVDYPAIIKGAGLNHLDGDGPATDGDYITYIIQPGDTLSEIALHFGTTVEALALINGIDNPDLIYAGNTLLIP